MKRTILMSLLLALTALPVAAQDFGSVFGQPLPLVAQMSQEERRTMRERWERASPEERASMRRMFQERLRQMPGGQFGSRAMDMGGEMTNHWQDHGFGTGYERRRYEDDRNDADRNGYGNERRGRGRR